MDFENKDDELDSLIIDFIDIPPSEEDFANYLDEQADSLLSVRLEAHFRRNPEIRVQMDEMKKWLDEFDSEDTSIIKEPLTQKVAHLIQSVSEKLEPLQDFFGSMIPYRFSLAPTGQGAPGNQPDFNFTFGEDGKCYGIITETDDKGLEVEVYFNWMELEGGLIVLNADNDSYTQILFKRGTNKVGAKFVIPADKREAADSEAKLIITQVFFTEQITKDDLVGLENQLQKMLTGSEKQRTAAEKILDHLNRSK